MEISFIKKIGLIFKPVKRKLSHLETMNTQIYPVLPEWKVIADFKEIEATENNGCSDYTWLALNDYENMCSLVLSLKNNQEAKRIVKDTSSLMLPLLRTYKSLSKNEYVYASKVWNEMNSYVMEMEKSLKLIIN